MAITFDSSELRALSADLTKAGSEIDGKVGAVVSKGAVNIKAQMRMEMYASTHFRGVGSSISYDIHGGDMFGVGVIEAEIGPETGTGSPGSLANIAYFGSSRGGGTVPDPIGALNAELPRFEAALTKILGEGV